MPARKAMARLNRIGLNRLTRRIAPTAPGFGVVVHRGRKSGKSYQTPVNVFPADHGYVIALTYGSDSDWVKNVVAAGEFELRTRGRTVRLTAPEIYHDDSRANIRPLERQILRLLRVSDFLRANEYFDA